jgi:hypothetical protein
VTNRVATVAWLTDLIGSRYFILFYFVFESFGGSRVEDLAWMSRWPNGGCGLSEGSRGRLRASGCRPTFRGRQSLGNFPFQSPSEHFVEHLTIAQNLRELWQFTAAFPKFSVALFSSQEGGSHIQKV